MPEERNEDKDKEKEISTPSQCRCLGRTTNEELMIARRSPSFNQGSSTTRLIHLPGFGRGFFMYRNRLFFGMSQVSSPQGTIWYPSPQPFDNQGAPHVDSLLAPSLRNRAAIMERIMSPD